MGPILANPRTATVHGSVERRLWDVPEWVKAWHLASLDAPTVAVAWAFGWGLQVRVPMWTLALLALVVWAIYVADRLLDARAAIRDPTLHALQERHFFHWRHKRVLAPLAAAVASAAAWMVGSRLHGWAIRQDSVVAAAALMYFSGVHRRDAMSRWLLRCGRRLVSREFVVGAIFSAGCLLPSLSALRMRGEVRNWLWLAALALVFAGAAWLNVRAIGMWECEPHTRGMRYAWLAAATGTAGLLLSVLLAAHGESRLAAVVAAGVTSIALLALLDGMRGRLTPLALRAAADLVLLTPLLLAAWR